MMLQPLFDYARLHLNLYRCRRLGSELPEFRFRAVAAPDGRYRIRLTSADSAFHSVVTLRRESSDLAAFVEVFGDRHYNLRRLARWQEIFDYYSFLCNSGVPLIIDLGANVGLASLYFAKNWPKARILAVEPEMANFDVMTLNLRELDNVTPVRAAVASEDGAVKIVNPDAPGWAIRTERSTDPADDTIPAVSVPTLLNMAAGCLPFIAKIDIEGFEKELFSQNTGWVNLFPIIIIELHDWMLPRQGVSSRFLQITSQQDRDFIFIGENTVALANWLNTRPAVAAA